MRVTRKPPTAPTTNLILDRRDHVRFAPVVHLDAVGRLARDRDGGLRERVVGVRPEQLEEHLLRHVSELGDAVDLVLTVSAERSVLRGDRLCDVAGGAGVARGVGG